MKHSVHLVYPLTNRKEELNRGLRKFVGLSKLRRKQERQNSSFPQQRSNPGEEKQWSIKRRNVFLERQNRTPQFKHDFDRVTTRPLRWGHITVGFSRIMSQAAFSQSLTSTRVCVFGLCQIKIY